MADADTTNRGLNELLAVADRVEGGGRMFSAPDGGYLPLNSWEDFSTAALFVGSTRNPVTKKLIESDRKTGTFSLAGDGWVHIDWDPEVGAIELTPIDVTGTDGIEITTSAAATANAGMEIPEGTTKELIVVGSPVGRLYVRRTNAGNGGNGSNTVKVNFACYGSRKMLGATQRVANTAHA